MTVNTPRKANKGEWSEIYAFFKILSERKIYGANEELEIIPEKTFEIFKVIRDEIEKKSKVRNRKVYDLSEENSVSVSFDGETRVVNLASLRSSVRRIFESIQKGKGSSFAVPEIEDLMAEYFCNSVKAISSEKSDIVVELKDRFANSPTTTGFSIKTAYKSSPTLFNSSKLNTNFLFEITPNYTHTPVPETSKSKVQDLVTSIYSQGDVKFVGVEKKKFKDNLELVAPDMGEILGAMLLYYFQGNGSTIADLCARLPESPILKERQKDTAYYKHRILQFLEAVSLGMTAARDWDGKAQANGGFIVVKDSGELACYHVHERGKFLEYLFANTRLDTPGTTKHMHGNVQQDSEGRNILRLNLQVRFV